MAPALTAKTAFLDAAKGDFGNGECAFVNGDHPVLKLFHDPEGTTQITGEKVACKPVAGIVGKT